MEKLIIEDIRCFSGRHEVPLAPLTVLVGENSTGKSTLLSAIRLAWDIGIGNFRLDFNEEPFDWGAFIHIAHDYGGRGRRAKNFTIGFENSISIKLKDICKEQKYYVQATFVEKDVQPEINELKYIWHPYIVKILFNDRGSNVIIEAEKNNKEKLKLDLPPGIPPIIYTFSKSNIIHKSGRVEVNYIIDQIERERRPYAIAPIRTKPRRTYDRRQELPQPEGNHIPMVLASAYTSDRKKWIEIEHKLENFGTQSGLFNNVNIKALGTPSDPFQVQIRIEGIDVNLVDVGYGINQILPIAVDCMLSEPGQILLMQQPEIHLHPKAQSALGSFLAYLVKQRRSQFVIETHSDYLIDRIRMDIRDGKYLQPEDIIILYLERKGMEVKVHPIKIDENGNLLDVPPGYRRFFLDEEKRLIGV